MFLEDQGQGKESGRPGSGNPDEIADLGFPKRALRSAACQIADLRGAGNGEAKWKMDAEQDGEFVGIGAVGVFGIFLCFAPREY